jgi:hypothetical protein
VDEETQILMQRAVIGGVVYLNGSAHGLTVAHAVQKNAAPDDEEAEIDEEDGPTYFRFLDDDNPDGESDDSFDSDAMSVESIGE